MVNKKIKFPFYFKTKDGLFCHTVSEDCNLGDQVIGIPKYFPLASFVENCRLINGKPYTRMPSYFDSIERTRTYFNKYLKYVKRFGEELCLFKLNEIEKLYDPQKKAIDIYKKTYVEKSILSDAKRLLEIIVDCFDVDIKNIGIEGSILLDGYNKSSDIDVVIYGMDSCLKIINNFKKLEKYPEIHLYSMDDIDLIFSRRYKYRSFKSNLELFEQEKKRTTGLINNRRFWLQLLVGSTKIEKPNKNTERVKINIIEDVFNVLDDSCSIFWPSFYTLYNENYGKIYLECYDPIYMNQAKKGEKVFIRGNLYIDTIKRKKYVILGPWIVTEQCFRKIT